MATAPKCKVCGARHWGPTHVFAGARKPLTPAGEVEAPLSVGERKRYQQLKAQVKEHWTAFAAALAEIRESRLYRQEYQTFEDFCEAEFGFTRQRASQIILAGTVNKHLTNAGLPPAPTEGVARALAALKDDPPAMVQAWAETVAEHGEGATAAQTFTHTLDLTADPRTAITFEPVDIEVDNAWMNASGGPADRGFPDLDPERLAAVVDEVIAADPQPGEPGYPDPLEDLLVACAAPAVALNHWLIDNAPAVAARKQELREAIANIMAVYHAIDAGLDA